MLFILTYVSSYTCKLNAHIRNSYFILELRVTRWLEFDVIANKNSRACELASLRLLVFLLASDNRIFICNTTLFLLIFFVRKRYVWNAFRKMLLTLFVSFYLCFTSNDKDRMTQIALIAHSLNALLHEKNMWMRIECMGKCSRMFNVYVKYQFLHVFHCIFYIDFGLPFALVVVVRKKAFLDYDEGKFKTI